MGVNPSRGIGHSFRPLLQSDIERAQMNTRSAMEAARYLNVDYKTYKKYAKMYGLHDKHINQSGRGISRKKKTGVFGLDEILAGKHPNYDHTKLKERLIRAGYIAESCSLCGFDKKREIDGRAPLVLHCKDGNKRNLHLENLELRCYNCFAGNEQLLTSDGVKTFIELVGTNPVILCQDGVWRKSLIRYFGQQVLQEVVFKPSKEPHGRSRSSIRHTVTCTPNHRWFTTRGEIVDLKVGDIVPFKGNSHFEFNLEAWIRGFGFGDGTIGSSGRAQIRLCGEKDLQWVDRFKDFGYCSISFPPSANGDAVVMFRKGVMTEWKILPDNKDANYLANWLEGYLAADGTITKTGVELCSQNKSAIEFAIDIAPLAGYIVTGLHISKVLKTNFGTRKSPLHRLKLQRSGCFKVEEITPLFNGVPQDVFCAVEPQTSSFVLKNGIVTGNCTYLTTGRVSAKHIMDVASYDKDVLDTGITMDEISRIQNELMGE
jgi:hypothetical protein